MAPLRICCVPAAVVLTLTLITLVTFAECRGHDVIECITPDDSLLKGKSSRSNSAKFAPKFKKQDQLQESFTNSENEDIRRKCRATGSPEPRYTWYLNNRTLASNDRVIIRKSLLTITGLTYLDEGTYTCVVENECGTIRHSFTQRVVVDEIGGKVPPVLIEGVHNETVYEGDDAEFKCLFYSNDPPNIWWVHYGNSNHSQDPDSRVLEVDYDAPDRYSIKNVQLNDSGSYECILQNKYGTSGRKQWLTVLPAPETPAMAEVSATKLHHDQNNIIIYVVVTAMVIIGIVTITAVVLCQRKQRQVNNIKQRETVLNPIYPFIPPAEMNIPHDPRWEFPRSSLELAEVLGIGFFGQVSKGYVIGLFGQMEPAIVAVKMLKPDATQRELKTLVQEMNTMKSIGSHINIINFLGCCTQDGPLYMLVEYAEHGNLRDFLRKHKPKDFNDPVMSWVSGGYETPMDYETECNLTTLMPKDLISFAYQIARGMEYLSSKKIIHRDLAARNILVGNDYILKIADFGLTKELRETDYYTKQTETPLPIKWMALECLRDKKFTPKSDVWSYGILLWEIFSFGGNPYPSVNVLSHERFYEWLEKGNRMDKPRHSPAEMYALMLKCWKSHAADRPSFSELVLQLDAMLSQSTNKDYLNLDLDLDYIRPIQDRCDTDVTRGDIDTKKDTNGAGSLVSRDQYLDDNVFSDDQTKLLVSAKISERSDSQYSSLPSSQEQSTKDDMSIRTSDTNSYDSISHGTYSDSEDVDMIATAHYSDINHNSLQNVINHERHVGKYTLQAVTPWSKSADDIAKMQSPLLSSFCYRSERHVGDESDSNSEEPLSRRNRSPKYKRSKRPVKPCSDSADSMIYVSGEDEETCASENDKLAHIIVYSNDKVECVESFV